MNCQNTGELIYGKEVDHTDEVSYAPDPLELEVNEDKTPVWLCSSCRSYRSDCI